MSMGLVSTLAARESLRLAVNRAQRSSDIASQEVSSGRHYDVGLALGIDSKRNLDLRDVAADLGTISHTNELVANRLSLTQSALASMVDLANGFFSAAIASKQAGGDRSSLVSDAKERLSSLVSLLSTTSNGAHLFSGANVSVAPMQDYLSVPPSAARTAVTGAFTAEFGFTPDDPQASSITAPQLDSYMDGAYAALYQTPAWQTTFSASSDAPLRDRIALGEIMETGVNANAVGIRTLVSTLVAVIDSGTESLGAEAFDSFATRLAKSAANASSQLTELQSQVGTTQERLTKANERIDYQKGLLEQNVAKNEGVDAFDASTRLTTLMTKLEVSYAVTARLQSISLLNYL